MQNRENTFLQKLKDNAFYIALGLGLIAILTVVAVYTMDQNSVQVAEQEVDLNQSPDYAQITTQDGQTNPGEEARAEDNEKVQEEQLTDLPADTTQEEITDTTDEQTLSTQQTSEENIESAEETSGQEGEQTLPATTDVGELNFTSDKTLMWPVKGDVLLPFSVETTVYFETLDQYKCNPGMLIAAGKGTTVQNAYLGKVTEVTSDDTYGNTVKIYLGNDFSLVYGQLDTVYVEEGEHVAAGASIGTVADPTDSFKKEGNHLFFQMYKGDEPVDPMSYME